MSFSPPRPVDPTASAHIRDQNQTGRKFASKMEDILGLLRTNLLNAQVSQEHYANAHRQPAPAWRVGDLVYVDTRNIKTDHKIKKLDAKFFGSFKIKEVVGPYNYRLDLPWEMKELNNSWHTTLLRAAPNNPLPGQTNPLPPPIALDEAGQQLWAVEELQDSKRDETGKFYFLVKWRGFADDDKSWEPLENVMMANVSIKQFKSRYPGKKQPTRTDIAKAKRGK